MPSLFPTFRQWVRSCLPRRTTSVQSQALLRLIAVALEENVPLASLLESWSLDERGGQRGRLARLTQLVKNGTSLPDAVEQVPGVLRDEDILAIRFDAQSGTRTAALHAALDDHPRSSGREAARDTLTYVLIVSLVSVAIVTFINVKLVPVLLKIASDFGSSAPPALQWARWAFDVVAPYWWLFALAACGLIWLIYSTSGRRFVRRWLLGCRRNPWRDFHIADVLQKLGVASSAGRPLAGALSTLARYHFDPVIRQKLLFVRNEVEQGAEIWSSMRTAGLLTPPEVALLNTAEGVGNRVWVLRQLAHAKQLCATRRWRVRATFLLPGFVVAMGALVLFQALAIFGSLTEFLRL